MKKSRVKKIKPIARKDLLFHAVHGLCLVDKVTRETRGGKKVACYSLVPTVMGKMKVRFLVAEPDLETSGFHKIISAKEAAKILEYLKAGDDKSEQTEQPWILARNILCFSKDKLKARDQRKRQMLEYSVRGLTGELASAFGVSLKESASRIEKSLSKILKNDSLVFTSLKRVAEN